MEMEKSIEAASNGARENPYTVLETSLQEELDGLATKTASPCIHRVPPRLRLVCEKAYTPQLVSLGPLHHGELALKGMEEQKMRYLHYFLGRTHLSLMHYIEKVKDREADLRSCYSETIDLESDEFVKIILVDAIFIIEFLFRYYWDASYFVLEEESDYIFGPPRLLNHVMLDLLLLENQLPFFILEELVGPDIFPFPSNYSHRLRDVESISIIFLSHFFLAQSGVSIRGEHTVPNLETICCSEVKHFVDLLRRFYVAPEDTSQSNFFTVPSIVELFQAGVQLKVGHFSSLFDIKFKDGILEIPKWIVGNETEIVLRNLVAFEQCNLREQQSVSNYVYMMGNLLKTPKDVGLLVECEIVENMLGGGNSQLSTLTNSLATEVYCSTKLYYGSLREDLNEYCSSPWHIWMANLRESYFKSPLETVSFVGGVVIALILTTIQTICSLLSLKP